MQVIYTPTAKEHLDFWVKTGNKPIIKKILQLTNAIVENPFEGIGKPEALKYGLAGYWSRRISHEDRYVYTVIERTLTIHSLKGHY
jgi:toxin YoeB